MYYAKRRAWCAGVLASCLISGISAYSQIYGINSAVLFPREFNDVPGAILTTVNNYPSMISFEEVGVTAPTGFANRDVWRFSNNGTSAYAFGNNDYFSVFMSLTLTGTPTSPRKEAGFLLDTLGGQGQFIVNTDGHEIVAFGGPLPFYAFPATFDSGETVTLGMTYFLNPITGLRSIIYSANGVQSPILPFTNLEQGIINGSTLGGYFQIVNAPNTPLIPNSGTAVFSNILLVPEPSALALLAMGVLRILLRRRS